MPAADVRWEGNNSQLNDAPVQQRCGTSLGVHKRSCLVHRTRPAELCGQFARRARAHQVRLAGHKCHRQTEQQQAGGSKWARKAASNALDTPPALRTARRARRNARVECASCHLPNAPSPC